MDALTEHKIYIKAENAKQLLDHKHKAHLIERFKEYLHKSMLKLTGVYDVS